MNYHHLEFISDRTPSYS